MGLADCFEQLPDTGADILASRDLMHIAKIQRGAGKGLVAQLQFGLGRVVSSGIGRD